MRACLVKEPGDARGDLPRLQVRMRARLYLEQAEIARPRVAVTHAIEVELHAVVRHAVGDAAGKVSCEAQLPRIRPEAARRLHVTRVQPNHAADVLIVEVVGRDARDNVVLIDDPIGT